MKNYEKIVKKMIEDFAEKGLIQCTQAPDQNIIDYLNYMGVVVVRANEQANPDFKLDEPMKEKIVSIVSTQWELYKSTEVGRDIVNFYEGKKFFDSIITNPQELNIALPEIKSKKMLKELLTSFIKAGDLDSVKKLIEKSTSPKLKVDVQTCVLAVEHNQPVILDYLFHKDKYQTQHEKSYMGIYTKKAMEYNASAVFNYTIGKGLDIEKEKFLNHAIFYKLKDYAYKLIDLGAKLEGLDSRIDTASLEEVTSYYNKKLVHDNLQIDLNEKSKNKLSKI